MPTTKNKDKESIKEIMSGYSTFYDFDYYEVCDIVKQALSIKNKQIEELKWEFDVKCKVVERYELNAFKQIEIIQELKHQLQTQKDDLIEQIKSKWNELYGKKNFAEKFANYMMRLELGHQLKSKKQ